MPAASTADTPAIVVDHVLVHSIYIYIYILYSVQESFCASTALLVLFRFFSLVKKCFLTRNSSNERRQERTEIPDSHEPEEPREFDCAARVVFCAGSYALVQRLQA